MYLVPGRGVAKRTQGAKTGANKINTGNLQPSASWLAATTRQRLGKIPRIKMMFQIRLLLFVYAIPNKKIHNDNHNNKQNNDDDDDDDVDRDDIPESHTHSAKMPINPAASLPPATQPYSALSQTLPPWSDQELPAPHLAGWHAPRYSEVMSYKETFEATLWS